MNTSRLYRVHQDTKTLQGVPEIEFSNHKFRERYDIQEWLEDTPEILTEPLFIIAKEKSCFEGTRELPDLVALDKDGNLVIIELKRDDSGSTIEWQAIKYASYYSRFKADTIISIYWEYLKSTSGNQDLEIEEAQRRLPEFIGEDWIASINAKQRIFLVSHRFAREVISAVYWLIDKYAMEIKCLQLIPYYDADKDSYYLQTNVILPVPGVDDVLIGAVPAQSNSSQSKIFGSVRKDVLITSFCEGCAQELSQVLAKEYVPTKQSRWAGVGNGYRYFHLWYDKTICENHMLAYRIWYYPANNTVATEMNGEICLWLAAYSPYLLGKNYSEKQVDELATFLKNYNKNGFAFGNDKSFFWTKKTIKVTGQLKTDTSETVVLLKDLIESTKAEVDKILST